MTLGARRLIGAIVLAVSLPACSSGGPESAPSSPSGPPSVQGEVVAEHAAQFDDKLPQRLAGSQEEFAAATYLLGHLQAAGYTPLLDPVPVKDLIRSTNVVASPPRSDEAGVVVAVPYDTPDLVDSSRIELPAGEALGLWLELARAVYARDPGHAVEFVALGAEHARVDPGDLGSRRLAEELIDAGERPVIVLVEAVLSEGEAVSIQGWKSAAEDLQRLARESGADVQTQPESGVSGAIGVFARANLPAVLVTGDLDVVAPVLLDYLTSRAASPSPSPRSAAGSATASR